VEVVGIVKSDGSFRIFWSSWYQNLEQHDSTDARTSRRSRCSLYYQTGLQKPEGGYSVHMA